MCDFGGDCGGAGGGVYNTPFNTVGVGDPVAPGFDGEMGSGDMFIPVMGMARKKPAYSGSSSSKKSQKLPHQESMGFSMDPRPLLVHVNGRGSTSKTTKAPKK